VFESKGIDPERPIIASCGTGVTAAIIDAALDEAEFGDPNKRKLYDGSWTWVPFYRWNKLARHADERVLQGMGSASIWSLDQEDMRSFRTLRYLFAVVFPQP
jgi:hypothetical protein